MTIALRTALSVLACAFTAYLAVGGLMWTSRPAHPMVMIGAVGLFLATALVCILWRETEDAAGDSLAMFSGLGKHWPLPGWAAALVVVTTLLVPSATWFGAGPAARLAGFATWSLGGVGALLAIVMVRRRPWIAWVSVLLLAAQAVAWIGPVEALARGLVGAVLWVGAAQLLNGLLSRAARDTARLTELQRSASERLASQEAAGRARRTLVQRALSVAGPVLVRTIDSGGRLTETERLEAAVAEGALRDEIRGFALLDDRVREHLARARRRGATVTVVDEGGLEALSEPQRAGIRADLADVLHGAQSQRLFIRTSTLEDVAVTVVGRSADADGEDAVDLWREIGRGRV